jgi:nucleotide-binding universal stress UspA family protein
MKRFKNILTIYNDAVGADDTLTRAAELARVNEARLTLLDVLPDGNWSSTALAERRKRLSRTRDALAAAGLDNVTVKVAAGNDLVEALRQVSKGAHDIVFASALRGGASRGMFAASLAIGLMRKCPVPVWIVKPGPIRSCSHVLAAVAPSFDGEEPDPVDVKILDLATSLTAACRGSLTVLNAWQVTGRDRETLSSEVPDATRENLLRKREMLCRTRVEELIESYRDTVPDIDVRLVPGEPEASITEAAESLGVDVIVMGTKCRAGLSGFLFGNAAEAILEAVNCGVLVVKPEAFEAQLRVGDDLAA